MFRQIGQIMSLRLGGLKNGSSYFHISFFSILLWHCLGVNVTGFHVAKDWNEVGITPSMTLAVCILILKIVLALCFWLTSFRNPFYVYVLEKVP